MKLPAFDHDIKKWDSYRHFYVVHHGRKGGDPAFVQFETGELMVIRTRFKPFERTRYDQFNVSITSTRDGDFKFLLPDGTPCPTAWLTQGGSQTLLVDHDLNRAYHVAWRNEKSPKLPEHLASGRLAYFRPGSEPIANDGVQVASPDRSIQKAHKEWLEEVRAAASAIVRINGIKYYRITSKYALDEADVRMTVEEFAAKLANDPHSAYKIATNGFQFKRAVIKTPYLIVKE